MSTHTAEHHILRGPDGTPLYAIIPWEEYEEKFEGRPDSEVAIPFAVAEAHLDGASLIKAWREHLGLTQAAIAAAMGVEWEQLRE